MAFMLTWPAAAVQACAAAKKPTAPNDVGAVSVSP
jgi:hypothetical protein